jgi:hypothetical protein
VRVVPCPHPSPQDTGRTLVEDIGPENAGSVVAAMKANQANAEGNVDDTENMVTITMAEDEYRSILDVLGRCLILNSMAAHPVQQIKNRHRWTCWCFNGVALRRISKP